MRNEKQEWCEECKKRSSSMKWMRGRQDARISSVLSVVAGLRLIEVTGVIEEPI